MSRAIDPKADSSVGHALLIDDDEVVRRIERGTLERTGWVVTDVATGRDGVAAAGRLLPDVIICDWMLPDLDGPDVITALAQNPSTASIPIVLVTTLGDADDIVRGIEAGAHDYVAKPFATVELEVRCRAALRVSRQHRRLARSEHELRLLSDNTSDLVSRCGLDGRIRYVSPSVHRLLGWNADSLIGTLAPDLVHPDDERTECLLKGAQPGEVVSLTHRLRRADGGYIWVESQAQIFAGTDGELEVLSSSRDVTQRHFQEEALKSAEERWRTAFERAPVGMAQIGLDARFLTVNPAFCAMLGYSAGDLQGLTPMDLSHPDDAEPARQGIADLVANRVPHVRVEKRYAHALGGIVWCAVSAVPVHGPEGRVEHLLAHYLDITELKRVETELQHLAVHDLLTGVLNRRGFQEALDRHVAHVDRYGAVGALMMLDLDGLKVINDTFGHETGDQAIRAAAETLRARLRSTDTIARLGGDEFAVILPNVDAEQAGQLAAALVDAIRLESSGHDPRRAVTASIGVALFSRRGRSAKEILADADRAMYDAKQAGRDRVAVV